MTVSVLVYRLVLISFMVPSTASNEFVKYFTSVERMEKINYEDIFEMKDCAYKMREDRRIEALCKIYLNSEIKTFPIPSQPLGLLLTNTFLTKQKVEDEDRKVAVGINKVVLQKTALNKNDSLSFVFYLDQALRVAMMFLKRVEFTLTMSHVPETGFLKASSNRSLSECLNSSNCSIEMYGITNIFQFRILQRSALRYQSERHFKLILKSFLAKWNIQKNNSVLEELNVSFIILNDLRKLRVVMRFLSFLNITTLNYVDSNLISLGGNNIFQFPDLKQLNFAQNSLREIDDETFQYLANLQYLNLSSNDLETMPRAVFYLKELRILDISKNLDEEGPRFLVSEETMILPKVVELYLSMTNLQKIDSKTFFSFPKVKILKAQNSAISIVEASAFTKLQDLEVLDLAHNKLKAVRLDMFHGLGKLSILNLSSCDLQDETFSEGKPLRSTFTTITLSGNAFRTPMALSFIPSRFIDMNSNSIRSWKRNFVRHKRALNVSLQNNAIDIITEQMRDDFMNLETVDLSNNPFDCWNCDFTSTQKWLNINRVKFKNVEKYYCEMIQSNSTVVLKYLPNKCWYKNPLIVGLVTSTIILSIIILSSLVYLQRWRLYYLTLLAKSTVASKLKSSTCSRYSYDAFVCYSDEDIDWLTEHLQPEIEHPAQGHAMKLCLHQRDFFPGSAITDNIVGSISRSRKILLIVSEAFLNSKWCMYETHLAQHRMFEEERDSIILIKLTEIEEGNAKIPSHLKYLLRTRTYLKWSEEEAKRKLFWTRLKILLKSDESLRLPIIP